MHACTHTFKHMHTHTHACTHASTHARKHACMHTYTHTHTHTHTHLELPAAWLVDKIVKTTNKRHAYNQSCNRLLPNPAAQTKHIVTTCSSFKSLWNWQYNCWGAPLMSSVAIVLLPYATCTFMGREPLECCNMQLIGLQIFCSNTNHCILHRPDHL